ncbi:MAG TPA: hypothetical protein VEI97_13295 [bacterium]|nr:hypothetical protein [bacterium]
MATGCAGYPGLRQDPLAWLPYLWTPSEQLHKDFRAGSPGSLEGLHVQLFSDQWRVAHGSLSGFVENSWSAGLGERVLASQMIMDVPLRPDGNPFPVVYAAGPGEPGSIRIHPLVQNPRTLTTRATAEYHPASLTAGPLPLNLGSSMGWQSNDPFVWNRGMNRGIPDVAEGDALGEFQFNGFFHNGKLVACKDPAALKLRAFGAQLRQMCLRHLEIFGQLPPTWTDLQKNLAITPLHYEVLPLDATGPGSGTGSLVAVDIARHQMDQHSYAYVLKYTRTPPGLPEGTLYLRYAVDYRNFKVRSNTVLPPEEFPRAQHLNFQPFLRAWVRTDGLPSTPELRTVRY